MRRFLEVLGLLGYYIAAVLYGRFVIGDGKSLAEDWLPCLGMSVLTFAATVYIMCGRRQED